MRLREYCGIPYFVDDGPPRRVWGIDDVDPVGGIMPTVTKTARGFKVTTSETECDFQIEASAQGPKITLAREGLRLTAVMSVESAMKVSEALEATIRECVGR